MDTQKLIADWIAAGNQYDTRKYLEFYQNHAILDDPSVGRKYIGHAEIKDYFESYFIGYKTQTQLVSLTIEEDLSAHLEVKFTGDFPEGNIGGTFDFVFLEGKIVHVIANLI